MADIFGLARTRGYRTDFPYAFRRAGVEDPDQSEVHYPCHLGTSSYCVIPPVRTPCQAGDRRSSFAGACLSSTYVSYHNLHQVCYPGLSMPRLTSKTCSICSETRVLVLPNTSPKQCDLNVSLGSMSSLQSSRSNRYAEFPRTMQCRDIINPRGDPRTLIPSVRYTPGKGMLPRYGPLIKA